jgi:hypothetical protein
MRRIGFTATFALAGCAAMAQQGNTIAEDAVYRATSSPKTNMGGQPLAWNPGHVVLFKGLIKGIQESAPMADGKSWTSLLVKLPNGGTALVELGPKDYVDAQSMRLRMNAPIWVAGSKAYTDNLDSVILAQRLNFDTSRHAFRRADGQPFWVR